MCLYTIEVSTLNVFSLYTWSEKRGRSDLLSNHKIKAWANRPADTTVLPAFAPADPAEVFARTRSAGSQSIYTIID